VRGNIQKEPVMKRFLSIALMSGIGLCGAPLLVGCDDTVDHKKSVEVKSDGTQVTKETKTTENADGSVTKTEKKDVDHAKNP
jgi:hypothetical protein